MPTSRTTLTYAVTKPVAISGLMLAKQPHDRGDRQVGIPVALQVAAPSTRLTVTVTTRVPKASGHGRHTIALGTLTRTGPSST